METLIEIPAALEANVFGKLDEHLKKIERALNVTMVARDGTLKLIGEAADVKQAESVLMQLLELARRGNTVTEQNVNYALGMILEHRTPDLVSIDSDIICHTIQGKPVKPKTAGQKAYIDLIRKKMIVFGIGPAGHLFEKELPGILADAPLPAGVFHLHGMAGGHVHGAELHDL